jgi:tetratricopeptide (TPR) repeat protein
MNRRTIITAGLILLMLNCALAAPSPAVPARDLLKSGRIDDATAALKSRLQVNLQDAEAYHLLCRAYYSIQRWDEAISNCERAIALQPDNSDYHLWLGRAYGEKADSSNFVVAIELAKKVRDQFERAVQLDPANLPARSDLAEFYVEAPGFVGGGKGKARNQAELIAKSDPAAAHWIMAILAEKEKKYDLAEQEFRQALQTGGYQTKHWVDLASFYRRRGRFDDMQDAINKVAAAPPNQRYLLFDAAQILSRAGRNFTGATQLLRTYINNGPPHEDAPIFDAHYLLGTILEKLGDRNGAAQEYRASLAMASGYQRAQNALRRLQE